MKRTKIVCTIGPASDKKTTLKQIVKSGMNVARLNFSHNVHSYHAGVIRKIRSVSKELKTNVAILVDLQGPRIRLAKLPEAGIKLRKNSKVVLTTEKTFGEKEIGVTYEFMHKDVKPDERILIADGLMELMIEKVQGKKMYCRVVNGGTAFSNKGINLPDTDVSIDSLSEKDKKDVEFAVKNKADFVALSFVRSAKDVRDLRNLIKRKQKKLNVEPESPINIIVKIERKEAVEDFDLILKECDAVMVARGDLGIELPVESVPLIQKQIIDKCLKASKPVIVATQMLESMIVNPRPTRAEASDVANAVIDHADAVMLSGETAGGKFPVEAVKTMSKIIMATEASCYDDIEIKEILDISKEAGVAIGQLARILSENSKAKAVVGASMSGSTGRIVSKFRPESPIYIGSYTDRVMRQLCLSWGVTSFKMGELKNHEDFISKSKRFLKKNKYVKVNDQVIFVAGLPIKKKSKINFIELRVI